MRMVRKQIQFTRRQANALGREAARRKVSESELVREAVDRLIRAEPAARDEAWDRILSLSGKFRSGLHDLSVEHDRYYADDLWEEIQEKRPR